MSSTHSSRLYSPKSSPPAYNSALSQPPSFQSSPSRSLSNFNRELEDIISAADSDNSHIPRKLPSKPIHSQEKLKKPGLLNSIPESVERSRPKATQTSQRSQKVYYFFCCPITCIGNCGPLWLAGLFLLAIAIIALCVALPLSLRHKGAGVPANTTVTVTSTLVVQSTDIVSLTTLVQATITGATTVTSSQETAAITPLPTAQPTRNFLGGFDVVYESASGEGHMFYTDRQGGLQHIYSNSDWTRANPPQIATNVKPGSPVSASLVTGIGYNQIHVFYVDNNNTINGLFKNETALYSTDTWYADPINLLQIKTSNSLFIMTCVAPDMPTYTYFSNASLYLYFSSPSGSIQKYAWTSAGSSSGWESMDDLPATPSAGEIRCQFAAGTETLWMINAQQYVGQWYRSNQTEWDWQIGFTGTDTVYENTSLLSISDSSMNRTHILFQDYSQDIQRYDFSGFGSGINMTGDSILGSATPGTRLATWANDGYCTDTIDVYYQEGNTSEVYYTSFTDSCYSSYENYGTYVCDVTSTTTEDQVMPLVQTYGNIVEDPGNNVEHPWKPSGWAILGIIGGIAVVIGLLGWCCSS